MCISAARSPPPERSSYREARDLRNSEDPPEDPELFADAPEAMARTIREATVQKRMLIERVADSDDPFLRLLVVWVGESL